MTRSIGLPVLSLVLAAGLWGGAITGTKFALRGFDPTMLLGVELVAATVALWLIMLARGASIAIPWRVAVPLGVLEPGLADLGQTLGLAHTSASNASLLGGLEATFVVIMAAWLIGEQPGRGGCGAVAAGLLGLLALEQVGRLRGIGLGDLLVLAGVLAAAGYTILVRRFGTDCDPLALTTGQFTVATVAVAPMVLLARITGAESVPVQVGAQFWLAAIAVGVGGFGLAFLLYNRAIKTLTATASALVLNLIPVFGVLAAVLCLDESLDAAQLIGGGLILTSVGGFVWTQRRTDLAAVRCQQPEPAPSAIALQPASPVLDRRPLTTSMTTRAHQETPCLRS